MKKAFTLIELIVVISILLILSVFAVVFVHSITNGGTIEESDLGPDYSYTMPEYESAKNSRIIAEQLKRQNDLMEQQLQQKNKENNQ